MLQNALSFLCDDCLDTVMTKSMSVTLTLRRGLQLLRAFRGDRYPLTGAELALKTGISRSSVSRLTTTLIKTGYLRRAAGRSGFELDWASFDLGHSYVGLETLTQLAGPLLQNLANDLDVTAALAVPDQLDMIYMVCKAGPSISTLRPYVGSIIPMELTSLGRAWLWAAENKDRDRYLAAIMDGAEAQAEALGQRIEASFQDLETTGVAMVTGEFKIGGYGIALPVLLGRNQALMAMSCSAVLREKDLNITTIQERVVPALKRAAKDLVERCQGIDIAL
jgi:DNA-binding IclR family transcriptional regulator